MPPGSADSTFVRIIQLDRDPRIPDSGGSASPAVGDTGVLVDSGRGGDRTTYIVECTDAEGARIWLAEFYSDEIELLDDSEEIGVDAADATVDTGTLLAILSIVVGNALAAFLSLLFLQGFDPWISVIAATGGALFGHLKARSFIDGLRITAILGIATWLLLLAPIPPTLARIWLSIASGFCAGKTIIGGYRSFRP